MAERRAKRKKMRRMRRFYERFWVERSEKLRHASAVRSKVALELVPPMSGGKVLDVGCGEGTMLCEVARKANGASLFGFDISELAARKAAEKGLPAMVADAEAGLPFKDNSFDLVICSEVLEHLFDPERALEEIRRVLKPTGRLIVSVPNMGYIRKRFMLLVGRSPVEKEYPAHIRFWTLQSFKALLRRKGFEVEKVLGRPNRRFGRLAKYFPSLLSANLFVRARPSGKG